MNPCPDDMSEVPDMEELSPFFRSLLTLENEICMMKQSSHIQIANLVGPPCRSEKQQAC